MDTPFRITEQLVRVLDVLLGDLTGEHYGFQVAKDAAIKTGTLYPIMTRLEDAGWLTSRWQDDDDTRGPRRRLYRLTREGLTNAPELVDTHLKTRPQRGLNPNPRLRPTFGVAVRPRAVQ